jgi:hypothetical protein
MVCFSFRFNFSNLFSKRLIILKKSSINKKKIRSAFILGSTSEVSKAISIELCKQGCQKFHLVARDSDSNNLFAEYLKNTFNCEVSTEKTELFSDANIESKNLVIKDYDLYLVTAGYLGNNNLARSESSEALKIIAANYSGLIPWITQIADAKRLECNSRLWIFSSVASDRGRPSNYHYGAAKSALNKMCEGILLRCHNKPFKVRIFKPGYIYTARTIKKAPKFLCTSPEKIAKIILSKPNKRGFEYLPWWWQIIMIIVKLIPSRFAAKL